MELTAAERHRLKKMAYGHKTPYQARQRATIVLLAARGRSNARIAAETTCTWTPCAAGAADSRPGCGAGMFEPNGVGPSAVRGSLPAGELPKEEVEE
ncbi:hypothetical protein [Streptosporangium sp. NBC_01756]|uniref:hypothetical protein n=1 Tax=Streptosporangium sp. NBC_01756 TaxID=2975950 RepID=UPI002DD9374F|nr:hypothetical protein [Streptosporangium sp. NBC_01756]WSC85806.1 hypothetical protein OIE48_36465 [Streptosporangium sp. NBC_01756]